MVPNDEEDGGDGGDSGFLEHAINAFGFLLSARQRPQEPAPKRKKVKAARRPAPEPDDECCVARRKMNVKRY